MKKCVLIINPNSGKDLNKNYLFEYQKLLQKHNYETIVYFTSRSKHATEIISSLPDEIDLVVSMGGDGTFNEVVSGNLKRENRLLLCHIPVGTTNDVGNMFGYGKDPIANLKLALDGSVKGIDICTINKQPFVYVAGFGKFMNVSYETPRELKSKYGEDHILSHISNNHIIALDNGLRRQLQKVKTLDIVRIKGYLVDVKCSNGVTWGPSSLTRTDDGFHSCEILYAEDIVIMPKNK